jgi:hypothetical protein
MKKFYVLGLALVSSFVMSQETISFEEEHGYELGSIHNQNGWTVTEGIDGLIENQIITDEEASEGSFSFKNAFEPDFDFQWFPIFGAAKEYETPFNHENFVISYDVMVTEKMGADFEFTLFSKDEVNDYYPIAGVGMEYQGNMYVISSIDYDYEMVEGVSWEENEWNNIKIEVSPEELKYFVNETLVFTGENYNPSDISGFNMLHNNYGGSAYYDNFKINEVEMNVSDLNSSRFSVYPNPVKDVLSVAVDSTEKIALIEVYSLTGQKVKVQKNASKVQVSELAKGTYVVKATTESGKVYTRKIVKG